MLHISRYVLNGYYFRIDYSVCGESSVNMRSIPVGRKRISKRGWWPWQIAIYKHGQCILVPYVKGKLDSRRRPQCFERPFHFLVTL